MPEPVEARETTEPEPGTLPDPLRTLLLQASAAGATDIHLDPVEDGVLIRFRVDGIIHPQEEVSAEVGRRLQNQIRVAADLDTEALFAPVEAQLDWYDGEHERDVRVVVGPTGSGETTHLRLLYASEKARDLSALGLDEEGLQTVHEVLSTPSGLILVGGQTGTGKTTTLYAMVSALDLESTVAVSVEDPVEFHLPLLRQFDVDTDRGFTIFKGLRTLLRMDPDVLLIGEIRDQQSAITAARAALAGRLILATIHAVDAATAIQTLHYLSVPYHILGDCLRLVAAQNLVRRVCIECAESRPLKDSERELFERHDLQPPDQVPTALGCEACNGYGYSGRIGVFETVGVEGDLAHAVGDGAELDELRQHIRRSGAPPMLTDALEKVANGVTTMDEVYQFHWPALEAG